MVLKNLIMIFTVLCTINLISGCNASITGQVIDEETQQPIDGAVVLVEWTKTGGLPGLSYSAAYKTIEVTTNSQGRFRLSEVISPMANPPIIAIYKKGFVVWSNHYVYPSWDKRPELKYDRELKIELSRFKKIYSHSEHVAFISSAAVSGSGGKLFSDAYLWEWQLAQEDEIRLPENGGSR